MLESICYTLDDLARRLFRCNGADWEFYSAPFWCGLGVLALGIALG